MSVLTVDSCTATQICPHPHPFLQWFILTRPWEEFSQSLLANYENSHLLNIGVGVLFFIIVVMEFTPRPKSACDFLGLLYCFVLLCICVVSCPYVNNYFPTFMAQYSLFVVKVPLNPKQTNKNVIHISCWQICFCHWRHRKTTITVKWVFVSTFLLHPHGTPTTFVSTPESPTLVYIIVGLEQHLLPSLRIPMESVFACHLNPHAAV